MNNPKPNTNIRLTAGEVIFLLSLVENRKQFLETLDNRADAVAECQEVLRKLGAMLIAPSTPKEPTV